MLQQTILELVGFTKALPCIVNKIQHCAHNLRHSFLFTCLCETDDIPLTTDVSHFTVLILLEEKKYGSLAVFFCCKSWIFHLQIAPTLLHNAATTVVIIPIQG